MDFPMSRFSDFDLLIKNLIEQNYTVIRMGRNHIDDYIFQNKNFIDFYNSEKNNINLELIETLLFRECAFIVSGNSGIDAYAALFKKKIFITNHFPAGRKPRYPECIFLPQIYKMNNKILNFNEIPLKILLSEDINCLNKNNIAEISVPA